MSNSTPESKPNDKKKVSIKEALSIMRWALVLSFRLDKFVTTLLIIGNIISESKALLSAYVFALVIDKAVDFAGSGNTDISHMLPYLGLLLVVDLVSYLANDLRNYSQNLIRSKVSLYIRRELSLQAIRLGVELLEDSEVSNNLQRAERNIYDMPYFLRSVSQIVGRLTGGIISAIVLLTFMPAFIPIFFAISLPRLWVESRYLSKIWGLDLETTEARKRADWTYSQLVRPESLKEIKITNASNYLDKQYLNFADWYKSKITKIYNNWYSVSYLLIVVTAMVEIVGYYILFDRFLAGVITIGTLTFQARALGIFNGDLFWGLFQVVELKEWALKIKDVKSIFDTKVKNVDGKKAIQTDIAPSIEFKNLYFKYPKAESYVIKELNLKIKAGEKIAIVGKNGAGKTTLVKLLSRIYRPESGEILINSHTDLNEVKINNWYDMLDVVYQDYNTYGQLTVRENVSIGKPQKKLKDEEIIKALEDADAWEFVKEYKNGLDQVLSERFEGGIRPSGGQWQKIALARFFYSNAPFVIFDEPTAAIDAESEFKIFNKIYDFFKKKTVIIISHRFSTVRNADRIVVLDEGKIIEEGSHEELLKLNGKYSEMFNKQAVGYK